MDVSDDRVSDQQVEKLRGIWFADDKSELRERIVQCVCVGTSNGSLAIRSMCAASIAMILRLDDARWPFFIGNLMRHILNDDVAGPLKHGSLQAFVEILDTQVLSNERVLQSEGLVEELRRVLFIVKQLVLPQYETQIRIDAAKFIFNVTKTIPCVVNGQDIVTDIVNSLAQGITCTEGVQRVPDDLFFMAIQCFYKLTETFYHIDTSGSVLALIGDIVNRLIESPSPDEKTKALGFWRDIAKFEVELLNKNASMCRYFVRDFPGLANILCGVLSCVKNEYDHDIEEDLNDTEPHMIAQVVLKMMYMFDQNSILDVVSSYFEAASASTNWQDIHGAILAVTVVCSPPVLDRAFDFVCNAFGGLMNFASGVMQNDRIRESALWAIGACIREYVGLLQTPNALGMLTEMLTKNIPGPPAAMRRGYNIIGFICLYSSEEDLEPYFADFMNLIWPMVSQMNPEKYARNAFYAMNALIQNSSDSHNELFVQWIPGLLGRLREDLNYECHAGICSSLSVIARKTKEGLQHGSEIINTMVDCLNDPNCMIMEDALNTISCVLRWIRPGEIIAESVYGAIMTAIDSEIPSVWSPAFDALGDLFYVKNGEMCEMAGATIMKFKEFIDTEGHSNENTLPALVKCIAMIVDSCGDDIEEDVRCQVVEMINLLSTIDLDGREPGLILPLYVNLVRCYANIYAEFSDETKMLDVMSRKVFVFVERIANHELYNFDCSILMELYKMFHKAGQALKQRINVKLNKPFVRKLVMVGVEGPDGDINVMANRIKAFIESL